MQGLISNGRLDARVGFSRIVLFSEDFATLAGEQRGAAQDFGAEDRNMYGFLSHSNVRHSKMSSKRILDEVTPCTQYTYTSQYHHQLHRTRSATTACLCDLSSRLILVSKHSSRSLNASIPTQLVCTHFKMASSMIADQVLVVAISNVPSMDIKDYVYATPTAQQQSAAVLQLAQAMFTAFSCQHPLSAWGLNGKRRFILVVSAQYVLHDFA